jgi:hypothetical protein
MKNIKIVLAGFLMVFSALFLASYAEAAAYGSQEIFTVCNNKEYTDGTVTIDAYFASAGKWATESKYRTYASPQGAAKVTISAKDAYKKHRITVCHNTKCNQWDPFTIGSRPAYLNVGSCDPKPAYHEVYVVCTKSDNSDRYVNGVINLYAYYTTKAKWGQVYLGTAYGTSPAKINIPGDQTYLRYYMMVDYNGKKYYKDPYTVNSGDKRSEYFDVGPCTTSAVLDKSAQLSPVRFLT